MSKKAVILFNLGGPDDLKSVRPFLFNLFNDPAIIRLAQPLRWLLAMLITTLRTRKAKGIYQQMGGKSPILDQTIAQATALEKQLAAEEDEYKTFVCMRYWDPRSDSVVRNVKAYSPDEVILLPLYPQYSTTTTESSIRDWERAARKCGLDVPTSKICCYYDDFGFIAAHVNNIKDTYWRAAEESKPRVLFSAHGLPESIIRQGDPYQQQVEKTVELIVQVLSIDGIDHRICYQSKVGPKKWIGPSTEEEIEKAGKEGVSVLVVPVAFVSEHSETLVELDVEYRELAQEHGVPNYWRVPALGTDPYYIQALAELCTKKETRKKEHCGYCREHGQCEYLEQEKIAA
ncbi:MAG: ferrochelatase [Alphaproteobacteria bacterium]